MARESGEVSPRESFRVHGGLGAIPVQPFQLVTLNYPSGNAGLSEKSAPQVAVAFTVTRSNMVTALIGKDGWTFMAERGLGR